MDDGDHAAVICKGAGIEGTLAEEVPDLAVYQARYHGAVQADDLRYGVVLHLASVLRSDVHDCIRPNSRHSYR